MLFRSLPFAHANPTAYCSLEKDPRRRGNPWRMLDHPWMVEMRAKRVNMCRYLSKVWGWDDAEAGPEGAVDAAGGTMGGTLGGTL